MRERNTSLFAIYGSLYATRANTSKHNSDFENSFLSDKSSSIKVTSINKSIINKSKDYNFTDQISTEHTGAKKSIGLTRIQDFSAAVNVDSGLVETKGPLIDNIKKMKFFSGDLHSFDMMLFWGTLRQNVKDRIKNFH